MKELHERFPSAVEALFIVVALIGLEFVIGAAFRDSSRLSGLDPRDLDGVVVLLGNAVLFVALMHYKRIDYGALFHPSSNSVRATVSTLSVPILLLVPALLLAVWAAMSVLVWAIPMSRWEEAMFERMMSSGVASVVSTCLLAPVLEEMLFRGLFLRSFLHQYSRWRAIWISAAIFGLAHMNVYQFFVGLAIGVLLGWIYERSRSLWPCILLHGAYNSALTTLQFTGSSTSEKDILELPPVAWGMAFALAFTGFTLLRYILVPPVKGEGR
jgi:membrane protease YdiL (CAAX protease family)